MEISKLIRRTLPAVRSLRIATLLLALVTFGTSGCGEDKSPLVAPTPISFADTAPLAEHLEELLNVMQANSVRTRSIDWARLRRDVFAAAGSAQTITEAYPAIELAVTRLDDFGSRYTARDGRVLGILPFGGCDAASPPPPPLPPNIGYVKIAECNCAGADADRFAESLQQAIAKADGPEITGWIVDLRGNLGGNMWPMIAGVGPILGEGIIGWIVYNDRDYEREYRDGQALSLGEAFARVASPYTLINASPRVAVLTNKAVSSAAEAVAVYFRGRPGTRSFGTPTCGHHHLEQGFFLSNRATLTLTTAAHEDRARKQYVGPITPDEVVADGEAINRAVTWLNGGGAHPGRAR
jgi:carboxyl-terminal processing protease